MVSTLLYKVPEKLRHIQPWYKNDSNQKIRTMPYFSIQQTVGVDRHPLGTRSNDSHTSKYKNPLLAGMKHAEIYPWKSVPLLSVRMIYR